MRPGLWDYIQSAFNARPLGMFVAPNWIGLAAFAVLGFVNPGFWLIGAGLELAYLYALSTNRRFQNYVAGTQMTAGHADSRAKLQSMLASLSEPDRIRYRQLEQRCRAILEHQPVGAEAVRDLQSQGEGFGKLLWIYLRLLVSRQAFVRLVREAMGAVQAGEPLERRAQRIEHKLQDPRLGEDLRKSLQGQLEILRQRAQTQQEAQQKLAFLDAELARVEQQVELIREQAVLSSDPAAVSSRIDQIAAGLSGTNQWIREQQQLYGQVADVLEEPPPLVMTGQAGRMPTVD